MVYVETLGRPSGAERSALPEGRAATRWRCRRPRGSGCRRTSRRMRARGRLVVERPRPPPWRGVEGGEALAVEAGDQGGDGVAGAAADGAGGVLVVGAAGDGQEELARVTSAAGAAWDRLSWVRAWSLLGR